jgi:hypothetical protein
MPLLYDLLGWNARDGGRREAVAVDQGFWRIPRSDPRSGRAYTEFLNERWYPLEAGRTYTQSFYIRHDGSQAHLAITFFTRRGHHEVPTHTEQVAPQVWRVWAVYTAQEGDIAVRALDFFAEVGNFSYLDVGWAQLEPGSAPTPYRFGRLGLESLAERVGWWVGTALMGFLVIQTGVWLFSRLAARRAAQMVLLGLGLHLGYALWQKLSHEGAARVAGLASQPNLFGHGAVMMAGLVWVLVGKRLGGMALLMAFLMVWTSGSRAALWGLLVLALAWSWGLGRWRWAALTPLGLLAVSLWAWPAALGRLSQVFVLDTNAQARLQFWQVALQLAREQPLGGVGFGNFPIYFQFNLPPKPIEFSPGHAHNLLLHLLAEGGLLSVCGLVVLLGAMVAVIFRARAWPVLTLLLVALLLNLLDYSFFTAWCFYPLMLATAWALTRSRTTNPSATMAA